MTETHQPHPAEETSTPTAAPTPEGSTPGGHESGQVEEFTISGDALVAKIKELIDESNVRRIVIKNPEDQVLIEIPLTVGVTAGLIGTALFPLLGAVGVIGAMVANLKLVVIRTNDPHPGA